MKSKTSAFKLAAYLSLFSTLFFAGLVHTQSVNAMVVRGGETYSLDSYAILEDDLYVVGEKITIAGTTTGDVLALGSSVEQSGPVSQDVLIVGGTVAITSTIAGDARIIGGKVYFNGHVTEDVFLAGGTVTIGKDAVIDGDLFVFADHLVIEGTVRGVVQMKVRVAELQGVVGKDVNAGVRESISFTKEAHVEGNLSYSAPREAFISDTARVVGKTDFKQIGVAKSENSIDLFGLMFYILLTVVSAVSLVYFFPNQTRDMTDIALSSGSGMRMAKGFLLLIVWPFVSLLLLISILGSIPGLILLSAFGLVFFIAMAFTPVLAGVFLARWMKKGEKELTPAWASFGAIVMTLIAYMPIFGWIIRILFFLLALHTASIMIYNGVWAKRKSLSEDATKKKNEHDTEKASDTKKESEKKDN